MANEKRITPFGIAWRAINGYMALAKKTKDWDAMEEVQELMGMMAAFSEKQSSSANKRWSNAPHESTAPMHRMDAPLECTAPMPKERKKEGKKEKKEDRFASIWVRVWLEVFGVEYQVAGGDKNATRKFTGVTDEQFEMAARDYMESTVYKNKSLGNFQWRIGEYLNKQKPAPKEEKFMDASMIDGLVGGLDF